MVLQLLLELEQLIGELAELLLELERLLHVGVLLEAALPLHRRQVRLHLSKAAIRLRQLAVQRLLLALQARCHRGAGLGCLWLLLLLLMVVADDRVEALVLRLQGGQLLAHALVGARKRVELSLQLALVIDLLLLLLLGLLELLLGGGAESVQVLVLVTQALGLGAQLVDDVLELLRLADYDASDRSVGGLRLLLEVAVR